MQARFWLFFLLLSLTIRAVWAQIGTWQPQVSYLSGQSVAVTGSKVYMASRNGLFYVDKTTSETGTLSKSSGLTDTGINRLLYLADQQRLLIGYRSGTIDFLSLNSADEPGAVLNINTIATATTLPTARGINHIYRSGNSAYLSTDFGIVVLDLTRNEVRDTYFSQRADGSPLPVLQTAATTDSLYALTAPLTATSASRGLRTIRFSSSVNIVDPANWRIISSPGARLESIAVDQNMLFATVNGQGIYQRQTGSWRLTQALTSPIIRQFSNSTGLVLATSQSITVPGSATFTSGLLVNPKEVAIDNGVVWVADTANGLLRSNGTGFQRIAPNGPTRDQFAQLFAYPQTLVGIPAGPLSGPVLPASVPPYDILSLTNGWSSFPVSGVNRPVNGAAYLAAQDALFLSTFGAGLWVQTAGQSPVSIPLPTTISPFITAIASDLNGNLWLTTGQGLPLQQATLHVRRTDGSFQSFPLVSQPNIVQIVPDDNGFLWLRPSLGGGLLVVDPATNRVRYLSTLQGQGGLLTNNVRALVNDRTGTIWVGTDLGPTVFATPYAVFDGAVDAQPPILNRRQLLRNELVTALAVDGGNRKWIGTQRGLYQVSADGSQLLNTFTAATSPLPGDVIQALAVEPVSGNVFVQSGTATDTYGLVSYRGTATDPADVLTKPTIFPNPVRPDFTGTVGISGLTDNVTVKILDAGGLLVYETRSQGGTATWDLRDYRGRQVQTGVYLVVVTASTGTESVVGKLAVVR